MRYFLLVFLLLFTGCEDPSFGEASGTYNNLENYTLMAWSTKGVTQYDKEPTIFTLSSQNTTLNAQLLEKNGTLIASGARLTLNSSPSSTLEYSTPHARYAQSIALANNTTFSLIATDTNGTTLAQTTLTLSTNSINTCVKCHQTTGFLNTAGISTATLTTAQKQKLGILELHDARHATTMVANFGTSNATITCTSCHTTNLATSLHSAHSRTDVLHPTSNSALSALTDNTACTVCHTTHSDAHTTANLGCQNCHGGLGTILVKTPSCQSCHQNGNRHTSIFSSGTTLRTTLGIDTSFSTNTTKSYSTSIGHGNLACQACHDNAHAIRTNTSQNNWIQGHDGTLAECKACHTSMPITSTQGPHGMHTIGQTWVANHNDAAKANRAGCAICHGSDFKGSPLSKATSTRVLSKITYNKGDTVSCYDCHTFLEGS